MKNNKRNVPNFNDVAIITNAHRKYIEENHPSQFEDEDFESFFQSWRDNDEKMKFVDYFFKKKRVKNINNILK